MLPACNGTSIRDTSSLDTGQPHLWAFAMCQLSTTRPLWQSSNPRAMLPVCRLDKERENAAALEVLPDLLKVGKGLLSGGLAFEVCCGQCHRFLQVG